MTSEDWKTVLLAAITALSAGATALIAVYGQLLLSRQKANDVATDVAASKASDAVQIGIATHKIVNGERTALLDEVQRLRDENAKLKGQQP